MHAGQGDWTGTGWEVTKSSRFASAARETVGCPVAANKVRYICLAGLAPHNKIKNPRQSWKRSVNKKR
jgi:hypothetical protein